MPHRLCILAIIFLLTATLSAQSQPPPSVRAQPVAPAVPPPPIFSNKPSILNPPVSALNPPPRSALDTYPHQPGTYDRLQDSIDRSTGRITDEQLYETERLQRLHDERLRQLVPQSEFGRVQEERERRLRIEEQARQRVLTQQQVRDELDRREYELLIGAGLSSPVPSPALADEKALTDARNSRDAQILAADQVRANALRQNPASAPQIESDYQQKARQIREQYDQQRQRILGFPAPTTRPTTAPVEAPQ